MDGASPRRNRFIQAGLLAVGGLMMIWGAAAAATQPDDGTDSAGMLAMSLVALGGASLLGSIAVLFRSQLAKVLGSPSNPAPMAPPGWYRVEFGGGTWRWWDGHAWSNPPD